MRPFLAIGSIGNEFAASISSSLSPPRPSRASKMPKISQKNCWVQFLRWQFLSVQDSSSRPVVVVVVVVVAADQKYPKFSDQKFEKIENVGTELGWVGGALGMV